MIKPEQNPRGPGVLEAPKGLIKGSSAENDLNKISHDPMLNSLTETPSLAPTPQSKSKQRLCDYFVHFVKLPLWQ